MKQVFSFEKTKIENSLLKEQRNLSRTEEQSDEREYSDRILEDLLESLETSDEKRKDE